VVEEVFGTEELRKQGVFHIGDGGDRWIIEGSRQRDASIPEDQTGPGKVRVIISKIDCQILALERDALIAPVEPPQR
jgi:hypothetical protein